MKLKRLKMGFLLLPGLLLGLGLTAVQAQPTMNVKTKSGSSTPFVINETLEMTFSDGKLVVTKKDHSTSSFAISDINFSNYNTTTTWNGNAWSHSQPTASDNAVVDSLYNDAGFSSLNLTVNAGKGLTVASGTLTVVDNLLLKSDPVNGTATLIDNGTLTVGGITGVEQFLTVDRPFWYISSPLSAAKSTTFNDATRNNIVLLYNEPTSAYTLPTAGLEVGKGYVVMLSDASDGVYTFTGGNLNTGNITINATRTGTTAIQRGLNMAGNPYPSYLNWDSAYQAENRSKIHPTIWYRTQSGESMVFQTYNAALKVSVPDGLTGFIPPLQAFWLKVDTDPVMPATQTTGYVNLTNTMRAHAGSAGNSSTNRLKAPALSGRQLVRLVLSNGIYSDETVIAGNANASDAFDAFDSQKMSNNNNQIPEIYSLAGTEKLAINGLNAFTEEKVVKIGIKPGMSNSFTIKATQIDNLPAELKVVLKDKLTGTEQDITLENDYRFSAGATESTSRFSLIFRAADTPSDVFSTTDTRLLVYLNGSNQIAIDCSGSIDSNSVASLFNSMGQQLVTEPLTGPITLINKQLAAGVYFVRVAYEGRSITWKIIIR